MIGKFLAVTLLFGLQLAGCSSNSNTLIMMPTENQPATFHRGVNASHYLSQIRDRSWADQRHFNKTDIAWIAARGYDHIRLPVDGPLLFGDNGSILTNRLKAVDQVIEWARAHGLGVILDMHKLPGSDFSTNPDNRLFNDSALQDQAIRLWTLIAERYRPVGDELRFEILNEPVAEDAAALTAFYARVIAALRSISPERKIILCSNRWGSFKTVTALEPLLDDTNLIVGVHYYEPHVFTHQGTSWVGLDHKDMPAIPFPGTLPDLRPYVEASHYAYELEGVELTVEAVETDFRELAEWAQRHNVELHLGEFGVYNKVDRSARERWYRAVLDQCERHDIAWAVWDYKGSFAVRDPRTGDPTFIQSVIADYLK
jgi:endoglucanase